MFDSKGLKSKHFFNVAIKLISDVLSDKKKPKGTKIID